MEKLTMVLQFIVGLSIIVGVHELGHMLMARLFGIRVDHFMIGFPPKIFKFKVGHTEYALGAIPLGGSAKIAGMIDESFDKSTLNSKPESWEYRAKPRWQRLLVVLGGIIFNMCFGVLIFISIGKFYGISYISKSELNKYGIYPSQLGKKIGFKKGDKIIKINNKENFKSFEQLQSTQILLKGKTKYLVERDGKQLEIILPEKYIKKINSSKNQFILFTPLNSYIITKVSPMGAASKADIIENDIIVSINDQKTETIEELQVALKKFAEKKAHVKIKRNNIILTRLLDIDKNARIGIEVRSTLKKIHQRLTLLESIPWGIKTAFGVVWTNILAIKHMIKGNISVSKSLNGPVGILQIFGVTFDFIKFWYIIAFLSMIIAFTNLLPIPALDGGHVVFIIYEMITGKELSSKVLYRFQVIGAVILLSIVAYTLFNDILKIFRR